MFRFFFIFSILVLNFSTGFSDDNSNNFLPSWIAENPGFKKPTHINSVQTPHGSIDGKGPGTRGWLVLVNEKKGHGIEIEVNKLCLASDSDFLMIAPWPLATEFTQIKLFTGNYNQTLKLLIPNTKAFFVLYDASSSAVKQEMFLEYRRCGSSLEVDPPTTESPIKKNTVFEVQLKGKPPKDYSDAWFSEKLKEALRAIANRYSLAHNISFNNDIPTQQMVRIHRVSFCPFGWPEREICASVEHSIFVSGVLLPDGHTVMDYELTAEHLRDMWGEKYFPELEELGMTVFVLPGMASTTLWWLLIIGLIIAGSLVASFVFWKADKHAEKTEPRKNSFVFQVKEKPKTKFNKIRRVPLSPYDSKKVKFSLERQEAQSEETGSASKSKSSSSELPIKNYYGSLLFASNAAFEDEEGNPAKEF